MKKTSIALALSIPFLFAFLPMAQADEPPPQNGKPLSKILTSVGNRKMGRVSEAEFEHGVWEVKVCKPAICHKLYINPQNGKVLRTKRTGPDDIPPKGATPILKIVKSIEAQKLGTISEIEFEHGVWTVKSKINPMSSETKHLIH